jgi:hypothetical protein
MVTPQDVAGRVVCGPDPEAHRRAIDAFGGAGFDHVYVHQVGREQGEFLAFCARELAPALR